MKSIAMRAAASMWAGSVLSAILLGPAMAQERQPKNPFTPFDQAAFETHLSKRGVTEEQLAVFRQEVEEDSVAIAADSALRALFPDYDKAVGLAEDGEPRAALDLTKVLSATSDAFLRAHCRYHLGRVFLDGNDPEQAVEVFAEYLRQDRNRSPLDGEVLYFYAHALADIPAPALAGQALRSFLEFFPDAPERYIASAMQQIGELEAQVGPLHEIADVMKGCERRIRKTKTGKQTQDDQQSVILKLETILEEMIEKEKQSSGAPSGLGQPSAPAANSAAPPGQTRIGSLKKTPGVAGKWGNMKDRDREAIETDLQTKLPGHYQRMLEEYYRKLNAGGR